MKSSVLAYCDVSSWVFVSPLVSVSPLGLGTRIQLGIAIHGSSYPLWVPVSSILLGTRKSLSPL